MSEEGEQGRVIITSSSGADFDEMTHREVQFDKVVKPGDPDRLIHIATSKIDQMVVDSHQPVWRTAWKRWELKFVRDL